ncbi:MAG: branched-chain amino acid ABC transporter permease [Burkholderiaceae bacterium]|jgi:branched-chain amino acid transport system permease protein|nr:branched-chain amino acid ABC transporter permease [Burkholderiaceae bacterium]HMN63849.1 branched-chain amino acid ABC transporter permease [Burkholderiaceae bacterium]
MGGQWVQFVAGGLTVGAIYALVALGFSIIFNASRVINFAQGEFVMIGGMSAVSLVAAGAPMPVAILGAVAVSGVVGLLLERLAVGQARNADVVTLIIITIGASIFLRGLAQLVWDKRIHPLPPLSGDTPISIFGATIVPQSLWVIGVTVVIVALLSWFFNRTLAGKAMLATSYNRFAAQLVGIEVRRVLFASFGLAAALGAIAGVLIAPITFTSYDTGIMLGLKGFAAAILGGLGNFAGAIAGGLVLGLLESLGAGYVSSAYKDVIAFVIILAVLFVRPDGILGAVKSERV